MKRALITGINEQDGSYLSELLINKNYQVHGILRRHSVAENQDVRIKNLEVRTHYGDLTDEISLLKILQKVKPDEIYNLAAMSHVKVSFELPEYTGNVDALGTLRLLEAIRSSGIQEKIRFYQASTSELYGKVQEEPQSETTPFYPRSPYGVAKLYAYWIVKNYRESYGMFACNGILFNHESPRRGPTFVTRKITRGLGMILSGEREQLQMGNIDSLRDWGHAKDYVESMWKILQQKDPKDFVIATKTSHSVKDFINICSKKLNIKLVWKNRGLKEIGIDMLTKKTIIKVDKKYFRETEVDDLIGDFTKAKKLLKWKPKHSFNKLVDDMISNELNG